MTNFGIFICGLNGCGKTTIGRELAQKLGFYCMDVENYYFSASDRTYSEPRSAEDVKAMVLDDMERHPCFVFSGVHGDMSEEIVAKYRLIVYLHAPLSVRMPRVQKRSYARFGARMEQGGDLYESEHAFFDMVAGRTPERIEKWLETVKCPILRLDGTVPISENASAVCAYIEKFMDM